MYAVKEVSREEWVFRGLAIAMCLAMVGLAVMPAVGECKLGVALAIAAAEQHKYGQAMYSSIGAGFVARTAVLKGIEVAALSAEEEGALFTAAEFALGLVPAAGIFVA